MIGNPILVGGGSPTMTNLSAANIKKGVTVKVGTPSDDDKYASVTGTFEGYVPQTGDIYYNGVWGNGWSTSHVWLCGHNQYNYPDVWFYPSIAYNLTSMRLTGTKHTYSTQWGLFVLNNPVVMTPSNTINISFIRYDSANVSLFVSRNAPHSNFTYEYYNPSSSAAEKQSVGLGSDLNSSRIIMNGSSSDGFSAYTATTDGTTLSVSPLQNMHGYIGICVRNNGSSIDINRIWIS